MIISVSRRTDIPRFYWDWFLKQIELGETLITNPFNAKQKKSISLRPCDVDGFVFWTRDPQNIAESAGLLKEKGYSFYVMISITGYPDILEPMAPDLERVVAGIGRLSSFIGKDRVFWRYDPIIISSLTTAEYHERMFRYLASRLGAYVDRCIISLYDSYKKSEVRFRTLESSGKITRFPIVTDTGCLLPEAEQTIERIAAVAHQYGLPLFSCAEPQCFERFGIKAHACVDGKLFGTESKKDPAQRPFCQCDQSVDIGAYRTCPARCVYCYAW